MVVVSKICLLEVLACCTDQVVVGMFGLQHSRDVLQVVGVDLLRASSGEGHGDDSLGDVRQVEFVAFLHPSHLLEQNRKKSQTQSSSVTSRHPS